MVSKLSALKNLIKNINYLYMHKNTDEDYIYIDAFFYYFWMKRSEYIKYKQQTLQEFQKNNFISLDEYYKKYH